MDSSLFSLKSNIRCLNTIFEATGSNALQVQTPGRHPFAEFPARTVAKHDWVFGPSEQRLGKEMLLSKERTRNHECVLSKFQQWCCVIQQWCSDKRQQISSSTHKTLRAFLVAYYTNYFFCECCTMLHHEANFSSSGLRPWMYRRVLFCILWVWTTCDVDNLT